MTGAIFFSPHYDDAVLSCGQAILGFGRPIVATFCTGFPPAGFGVTDYDARSGFQSSKQAMVARAAENVAALDLLGADGIPLGGVDTAYGGWKQEDQQDIATNVIRLLAANPVARLVVPLGITHPDHERWSDWLLSQPAVHNRKDLWIYEELPYRVLDPVCAMVRLNRLRDAGWNPQLKFLGDGQGDDAGMARKEQAVNAYASQLWALPLRCVFVPERTWKLTPT